MPSLDGGHYFLTVLAPIRTDFVQDETPGRSRSHNAQLAQALASLPTGRQTAASPPGDPVSPFSRNTLNHFARFVIIGTPEYNGRAATDTLLASIKGIDPLVPGPVDRLPNPYLLFAADFDAQHGSADEALRGYTEALWSTMQSELRDIFGHCVGFTGITTAAGFHDYIARCQIETTMPFNDYWANDELKQAADKPQSSFLPTIAKVAGVVIGAAIALWLIALVVDIATVATGGHGAVHDDAHWIITRVGVVLLVLLVALPLLLWIAYRVILKAGAKPFPTAPDATLPTILKSLYLQRAISRFAIDAQGLDEVGLHAAFGRFLADVKPGDALPTQAAGALEQPR